MPPLLSPAKPPTITPSGAVTLPCAAVTQAPAVLKPRVLRLALDALGAGKKDFTAAHYRALEDLCRTGGALSLPGGASAVCRDGVLTLSDAPTPLDEAALRPGDNLAGPWRITLSDAPAPDALALRSGPWTVRPWRRDDRLTLPGSRGSRSLKRLFAEHGVIVSAKPEQRRILEIVNERYDLELNIPESLKLFQLSEEHRRLVVVEVTGLRRKNGSLLPEYTEEEFNEATFIFVKYYIQGRHYDELVEENKKLQFELDQEVEWRNRTDNG